MDGGVDNVPMVLCFVVFFSLDLKYADVGPAGLTSIKKEAQPKVRGFIQVVGGYLY